MSVNIIYDQILWDPLVANTDPSSGTGQKELVCYCLSGVALTK